MYNRFIYNIKTDELIKCYLRTLAYDVIVLRDLIGVLVSTAGTASTGHIYTHLWVLVN